MFEAWNYYADTNSFFRSNPGNPAIDWRVAMRDDGWVWFVVDLKAMRRLSSEFGPFPSSAAAMADCETVHKRDDAVPRG